MREIENGYTIRMSKGDGTLRDSFLSMLSHTELTDCVLVCHQSNQRNANTNTTDSGVTGSDADNNNSNGSSLEQQTTGHNAMSGHIKAHRAILSASSDFFRSIFDSIDTCMSNNGFTIVVINDINFDDLDAIVQYIYNGNITVDESRLQQFIGSARKLSVKGLMNIQLMSSDKTLIERTNARDVEINRLKLEKRELEHELKAIRETEKREMERYKMECELELNNKFDCEKKELEEATNQFECERNKFISDRKRFEKCAHTSTTKTLIGVDTVDTETQQTSKSLQSTESPRINRIISLETPSILHRITSETESECRKLRKSVRFLVLRKTSKIDNIDERDIYETEVISGFDFMSASLRIDTESRALVSSSHKTSKSRKSISAGLSTPTTLTMQSISNNRTIGGQPDSSQASGSSIAVNNTPSLFANQTPKRLPERTTTSINSCGKTIEIEFPAVIRKRCSGDSDSTGVASNMLSGFHCKHCPQVYTANKTLQDHINCVHLKSGQTYECEFCHKVYTWRISLNKHLRDSHPNQINDIL